MCSATFSEGSPVAIIYCNLFDVELSSTPSYTKISMGSESCTVHLLGRETKISEHVSEYGNIAALCYW